MYYGVKVQYLEPAVGRYHIKINLPVFVSYLGKKRGAVFGKRFTFHYEHVRYNVSGP